MRTYLKQLRPQKDGTCRSSRVLHRCYSAVTKSSVTATGVENLLALFHCCSLTQRPLFTVHLSACQTNRQDRYQSMLHASVTAIRISMLHNPNYNRSRAFTKKTFWMCSPFQRPTSLTQTYDLYKHVFMLSTHNIALLNDNVHL